MPPKNTGKKVTKPVAKPRNNTAGNNGGVRGVGGAGGAIAGNNDAGNGNADRNTGTDWLRWTVFGFTAIALGVIMSVSFGYHWVDDCDLNPSPLCDLKPGPNGEIPVKLPIDHFLD